MIAKPPFCQIAAAILSLGLVTIGFPQGPLTPGGPPAPTMKTLSQMDARVGTAGERIPVNATTCPGDGTFRVVLGCLDYSMCRPSLLHKVCRISGYRFTIDIISG